MKNYLRFAHGKNFPNPLAVLDIGDKFRNIQIRKVFLQFGVDVKYPGFILVKNYQLCRLELGHLPRQFRTDRSGGAGNQNPLARDEFFDHAGLQ